MPHRIISIYEPGSLTLEKQWAASADKVPPFDLTFEEIELLPVVHLITATESAPRSYKLALAALASTRLPPCHITVEEREAIMSLNKDNGHSVLPVDKERCRGAQPKPSPKSPPLLSNDNTKTLKRDLSSPCRKTQWDIACMVHCCFSFNSLHQPWL